MGIHQEDLKRLRNYTDIIHGIIPYNGFEKIILQTPLLMRLQRISQNSLAFLTFPSNKIKRYEHSLGVMHLANKCIRSALINTNSKTLCDFFDSLYNEINEWARNINRSNRNGSLAIYSDKYFDDQDERNYFINFLTQEDTELESIHFFTMQKPGNIPSKYGILCACLIQGVRLSGMLHDLGHAPYSHTLETIIELLYSYINSKDQAKINDLEKQYLALAKKYTRNVGNIEEKLLHEALSEEMFDVVEEEVASTLTKWDNAGEDMRLFSLISIFSFRIAHKLLYEKSSFIYRSMHSIISGLVDVDRLDYASRDLFCSAVSKDIINYDRLFLNYAFYGDYDENGKMFIVAPEVKSIQDIEAFLRKRWSVYRDIVYHHNVHKSELLMRRLLIKNSLKNLMEEKRSFDKIINDNKGKLPTEFILSVMVIFNEIGKSAHINPLQKKLLMFDDAWLDTVLKVIDRGDELIDGREKFKAVIKRYDDYCDFDDLVSNKFKGLTKELQALVKKAKKVKKNVIVDDISLNIDLVCSFKEHQDYLTFGPGYLFTNLLLNLLGEIFAIDSSLHNKEPISLFQEYIYEERKDKYNSDTIFLGIVDIESGFSKKKKGNRCKLWKPGKGKLVDFEEYSSIKQELEYERDLMPSFHLYKDINDGISDKQCLDDISKLFSDFAYKHIFKYLQNCAHGG
jgi:HD superfamily phosphohydrolase